MYKSATCRSGYDLCPEVNDVTICIQTKPRGSRRCQPGPHWGRGHREGGRKTSPKTMQDGNTKEIAIAARLRGKWWRSFWAMVGGGGVCMWGRGLDVIGNDQTGE